MATFTKADMRARAQEVMTRRHRTAKAILEEASVNPLDEYDVFLSYSSTEANEFIIALNDLLTEYGLTVYIDKYVDPNLTPDKVTRETAETLRTRLRQSKSLLFLHSEGSHVSKWMPWELGFADGFHGKIGVFPITDAAKSNYAGQEYLGMYPYVGQEKSKSTGKKRLWIWETPTKYAVYERWVKGNERITERKA